MYIWWMSLDVPISLSSIVPSTAKSRPSPRLRRQQRAQPQWLDFCSSHSEAPGTCWPWPWSETCSETWPPRCWPWAWWIPFPHIQQPPRNPGFRGGFTHIWDHIWVFKYLEYSGDHPRKQPVRLLLRICIAFRLPEGKKSGDVLSRGFEPLRKWDVDHSSQKKLCKDITFRWNGSKIVLRVLWGSRYETYWTYCSEYSISIGISILYIEKL